MKLTNKQQEIVNYTDGSLLVTAGPGSGKTRVLTYRIDNILKTKKGRVLALTFSNKAAEEITERITGSFTDEEAKRVKIETIHSFCLDIVMNKGNLIGLPPNLSIVEDQKDKIQLLKRVIKDSTSINNDEKLNKVLMKIQHYKKNFISPDMLEDDEVGISNVYLTYNNILLKNNVIDFDDILFYAYKILIDRPKVASNYTRLYKYIMIDEAQDLNRTQYKIIKALTQGFKNIMMVGDPDQSIYGFNGSDSSIMTDEFVRDFEPKEFSLNENFRSTSKIIEAAKKIQPETISDSVFPLEGEFQINSFDDELEEAKWITERINSLLENGSNWKDEPVELEDIAIIGRNKYLFNDIEECFIENELDYTFGNSNSNLESESIEMKIHEAGVKVLINQFDELSYEKICSHLGREKVESDYLTDILTNAEVNNPAVNTNIFSAVIESWNTLKNDTSNFSKSLRVINNCIDKEMLDEDFLFLIKNDLDLWEKRWRKYCGVTVQGDRSLSYFRNQVSLGKMNTDSSTGISLMTVHMSKGLEFDIVFIVGLTQGTFPDYRVSTSIQKKEELNNMFVAITRAKRECYLTYPIIKMMPWGSNKVQEPSEYIKVLNS